MTTGHEKREGDVSGTNMAWTGDSAMKRDVMFRQHRRKRMVRLRSAEFRSASFDHLAHGLRLLGDPKATKMVKNLQNAPYLLFIT